MIDREALAAALERRDEWLRRPETVPMYSVVIEAAARERLAQLPDADGNYPPETVDLIADTFDNSERVARQRALAVLDALNTVPRSDILNADVTGHHPLTAEDLDASIALQTVPTPEEVANGD